MKYHGSPNKFSRFRAPSETGNFRPSEAGRRHHRDVVFASNDVAEAIRYAGPGGYLYLVDGDFHPYDQDGKKSPVIRDGVYTAHPGDISICLRLRLAPRRRNQSQAFFLEV